MKKIFFTILILIFCNNISIAEDPHLMDNSFFNDKLKLEEIYYTASTTKKISSKDKKYINNLKESIDAQKKSGNRNIVPLYYKLGCIYREVGMTDEAKSCFKTIVKYYSASSLYKKSLMMLTSLGGTNKDENGRTTVIVDLDDLEEDIDNKNPNKETRRRKK